MIPKFFCHFRNVRYYSEAFPTSKKGLVLGAYDCLGEVKLTPAAEKFDSDVGGKLSHLLKGCHVGRGKVQIVSNVGGREFACVAVAGLGPPEGVPGRSEAEGIDQIKENIRIASGAGAAALHDTGLNSIHVEGFGCPEAAAEGAALAVWKYEDLKTAEQPVSCKLDLHEDPYREGWQRGEYKASAQNLARNLEETPANLMTPSIFAQSAADALRGCGPQVEARDRDWLENAKMNAFLGMAKGSSEPPLLVELSYCGGHHDDKPIAMIGKGITFDSGGVSLKDKEGMSEYRGDMAGAAVVVGVFKAIASMNIPVNVNALIPLCENLPGGSAIKPGDVLVGLSGKSIHLETTDHEGRVILSDALSHSVKFKPCLIVNVATLTNAMRKALGAGATGVFSTSDVIWRELSRAGSETGDRVWRLPLWKCYRAKIKEHAGVDVNNVEKGARGGACLGAAFLMEFVPPTVDFLHLDITGTGMLASGMGFPYLRPGTMTGRPTRTLIQFLYQMACPQDEEDG